HGAESRRLAPATGLAFGVVGWGCVAKWEEVGYCGDRVEAQDRGGEAPPTSSLRSLFVSVFRPPFQKGLARWPSGVSTSTASIPRTGSRFPLASGLPSLTESFSP